MINIKSNKGITITTLIITVIIMLILSGVTLHNFNTSNEEGKYNNMVADIKLLNDKILIYYNKYGEIPKTNRTYKIDNIDYFEIDLSKLDNLTLNYGKDYGTEGQLATSSDVYLVNSSLNIYYLKGVEKSGETYHEK